MRKVYLAVIMCLAVSTSVGASSISGDTSEYGETIDEAFMQQEDSDGAEVIELDLSKIGSEVIYDIASKQGISARRKAAVVKGMELIRFTKYNLGSKATNDTLEKPRYLDCSGFVQWALLRATGYDIGHGTAAQYADSIPIEERELQIGDLGFKKPGGAKYLGGGNHVGIFVGKDKNGNKLWLHCTSGSQNGVNISTHSRLVYYTRPMCY